jgi:hypothetical protein
MQRLTELRLSEHLSLLPGEVTPNVARERLATLLAARTGPETTGLFAESRDERGMRSYFVPPGDIAAFDELDAEGQGMLRAELGRLISELRRAAEAAAAASPAEADLPALVRVAIELPRADCIYAHEGRPVLVGWGLAPRDNPQGLGLLLSLDDGRGDPLPPTRPWGVLGMTAGALLALGALAGVAVPLVAGFVRPEPAVCQVVPGHQAYLTELLREQEREARLRGTIAEAMRDLGARRLDCPLPPPVRVAEAPPPPPPSEPEPAPQPEPPPSPPPPQPQPQPPQRPQLRPEAPRPPQPPPRPQPPPGVQPCNVETRSGGAGITETRHYLGPTAGRVRLQYNAHRAPDRIIVYDSRGRPLATTQTFVSGQGTIEFDWNPPPGSSQRDQVVLVEVTGGPGEPNTIWNYNLGCPGGR